MYDLVGQHACLSRSRTCNHKARTVDILHGGTLLTVAGVVLVGDFVGDPQAYDLSCPVEVKRDVRISIDPDQAVARCAVCGSTYDVFRQGAPLSGKAAEKGYAMRKYRVGIKTDGSRWIGN